MPSPVKLDELVRGVPDAQWVTRPAHPPGVEVRALRYDSRRVEPGDLFFALPGVRTDGAHFAGEALARGAVAVVLEGEPPARASDDRSETAGASRFLRARSARRVLGLMAARFHGEPARHLRVVGLTGTDGKTSTAWLVRHVLAALGRRAVAAGTLGLKGDDELLRPWSGVRAEASAGDEPHRTWQPTTPEAPEFQATLAELRAQGVQDLVTEVSSHALEQDRVFGTQFHTVALLGVSADHLDFHKTPEAYHAAKARLFERSTRGGPLEREPVKEVLCIDHELGRRLACASASGCVTFGRDSRARVRLVSARSTAQGQQLDIDLDGEIRTVRAPLLGRFHAENLLAAVAIAHALGIGHEGIGEALQSAPVIPGRFETVDVGQPFAVVVDYAHTADALARLLHAARELTGGRVILVFGCGGDRDVSKREPMGRVAAAGADLVLLTDDNPRSEDPERIAAQVAGGLRGGPAVHERIGDRRAALRRAVSAARPGDVVVVAGKGSEGVQIFRDRVAPFDDRRTLRELLKQHVPTNDGGVAS